MSSADRPLLRDSVDVIADEWAVELPDLPVQPIEVVTRLARLRAHFDESLAGLFSRYDLTSADFTVIASLRRAGAPFELAQTVLMHRLGLTSGTVSVRLTRLAAKGVVERTPSPDDGRGTLVRLTALGQRLFEDVAPAHLHHEDVLLSALSPAERTQLAGLLRTLLVAFEHPRSTSPLGMTLAPAHVARRMRATVGLPDDTGILVLEVDPGGPAARGGLRAGDLLVTLDGAALRSCADVAGLGPDAGAGFGVRRGTTDVAVELPPAT